MLLARPYRHDDECIVSYLIRVAELNGFRSSSKLLQFAGLNWKNGRIPIREIQTGQFDLQPYLNTLQLSTTVSPHASHFARFRKAVDSWYPLAGNPRYCPLCLDELGYCLATWAFGPITVCDTHKILLIDSIPNTNKPLSWYRPHLSYSLSNTEHRAYTGKTPSTELVEMSSVLRDLLGKERKTTHKVKALKGLPLRGVTTFLDFVCSYQARANAEPTNFISMRCEQLNTVYTNAWKLIQDWPKSFYSLLDHYVDNPMENRGNNGVRYYFRDILDRIHRQQENEGIARIKVALECYIQRYWKGSISTSTHVRLDIGYEQQTFINKKQTQSMLNCGSKSVDKLVERGELQFYALKGAKLYKREEVASVLARWERTWSFSETTKELEISRSALQQLLSHGVIRAILKPSPTNRDWTIDKRQAISLIRQLKKNATPSDPNNPGESLRRMHQQGYSLWQLIRAMQKGKVRYSISPIDSRPHSFNQFNRFYEVGKKMQ